MKKNKKFAIILLILIALLSVLGVSYAVWRITDTQTEFNQVGSKCFELTMINESEAINLEKTYPISDEEGLSTTGYTFTVKNICNTYATYTVDLEDLVTEAKRLSGKYIKVSVNDGTPEKLIEYQEKEPTLEEADKAYELTSGSLAPEEEATYTIKLWMDYDTPALEETINATFLSKVTINAGYIEEGALENELTLRIESQTEQVNNQEEVFKIIGTSEKYNIIEYSEDNTHWTRVEPTKQLEMLKTYTEEGSYKFYIKDEVGNTKEIEIIPEKLDKTAPEIEITPVDNQETIELSITLTDKNGIGGYAITESDEEPSEWNNYESTITYTVSENKNYYIWAKDSVGNITYQMYSANTIDATPPELTITNTLTDWGMKDTINIKATDDIIGITGISVSKNEGEYNWEEIESTLSYETTKEVTENGTYYISVRDGYGHTTTKSIVIDKIDDIPPSISFSIASSTAGTNNWYQALSVNANVIDNEMGVSSAKYCVTTEASCTPNIEASLNNNSFSYTFQSNTTAQKICVESTDVIGNNSGVICSNSYLIDTTNPTARITATASRNTITVSASGSSDAHSKIASYQYSKDNSTWYTSTSTTYTFTGLADGTYTLYVRVIDNSGRTSTTSTTAIVAYTNVYISSSGIDGNNRGSINAPFKTLEYASEHVASKGGITLLSDIVVSRTVYIHDITIQSYSNNKFSLIRDSNMQQNNGNEGTRILAIGGNATLNNIILDGKSYEMSNALVEINSSATVTIQNVTFQNSIALNNSSGSALVVADSALAILVNCEFINNIGTAGAIFVYDNGSLNVTNTSFINNQDYAIYLESTAQTFDYFGCTFSGNSKGNIFDNR